MKIRKKLLVKPKKMMYVVICWNVETFIVLISEDFFIRNDLYSVFNINIASFLRHLIFEAKLLNNKIFT